MRLRTVQYLFPVNTDEERMWFHGFQRLLSEAMGEDKGTMLKLPATIIHASNGEYPEVRLHAEQSIALKVGALSIANTHAEAIAVQGETVHSSEIERPAAGMIPERLYQIVRGTLSGLDHSGMNFPRSILNRSEWDTFLAALAPISNLYRYPDEEWPFILPADEREFREGITDFTRARRNKIEFVYDEYADRPLLQFAVMTRMTRKELEAKLPAPYGYSIPGLEDYFRSVILDSPWQEQIGIRIDLYYATDSDRPTDWESGEWLVTDGGRIM